MIRSEAHRLLELAKGTKDVDGVLGRIIDFLVS